EDPRSLSLGREGQASDESDRMDLPVARVEETCEKTPAGEEPRDAGVVQILRLEPVLDERLGASGERFALLLAECQRVAAAAAIEAIEMFRLDKALYERVIVARDGPQKTRSLAAVGFDRDAVRVRDAAQEKPGIPPA